MQRTHQSYGNKNCGTVNHMMLNTVMCKLIPNTNTTNENKMTRNLARVTATLVKFQSPSSEEQRFLGFFIGFVQSLSLPC